MSPGSHYQGCEVTDVGVNGQVRLGKTWEQEYAWEEGGALVLAPRRGLTVTWRHTWDCVSPLQHCWSEEV